MNGDFIELNKL